MTAHAPAHPSTARRASGVKPLTAGTPPSSRGRKAHNCSPSGGTGGVSPGRAEAHAEDARSALTRRLARSYLRPDIAPSHRACAVHSRESTSVPSRLSSAAPPLSAEPTGLNPPTPVSGEPRFSNSTCSTADHWRSCSRHPRRRTVRTLKCRWRGVEMWDTSDARLIGMVDVLNCRSAGTPHHPPAPAVAAVRSVAANVAGAADRRRWTTIMAYPDQCNDRGSAVPRDSSILKPQTAVVRRQTWQRRDCAHLEDQWTSGRKTDA